MGQSSSMQEDKMKKRIRQAMGTFMDFGAHLKNANEWYVRTLKWRVGRALTCDGRRLSRARICTTPKNCYLSFRIVVDPNVSAELLPYVWRIRGNVAVEVRKMRRPVELQLDLGDFRVEIPRDPSYESESGETIGQAKTLTIAQFYYIYCFLSDVKACAAHTVRFPEKTTRFAAVSAASGLKRRTNFGLDCLVRA
jgi:hypothetical protein